MRHSSNGKRGHMLLGWQRWRPIEWLFWWRTSWKIVMWTVWGLLVETKKLILIPSKQGRAKIPAYLDATWLVFILWCYLVHLGSTIRSRAASEWVLLGAVPNCWILASPACRYKYLLEWWSRNGFGDLRTPLLWMLAIMSGSRFICRARSPVIGGWPRWPVGPWSVGDWQGNPREEYYQSVSCFGGSFWS